MQPVAINLPVPVTARPLAPRRVAPAAAIQPSPGATRGFAPQGFGRRPPSAGLADPVADAATVTGAGAAFRAAAAYRAAAGTSPVRGALGVDVLL